MGTRLRHYSAHTTRGCATGVITEIGTGFPGYNSVMPKSCGTVAEILKQNGWNTSWYGKNHNVPDWQTSQAGPFDLWPTHTAFAQCRDDAIPRG
jgi:arylsulfatase